MAPGSEAIVDVFAFWGGIDLKVPEDWTVVLHAMPLMGAVDDKTRPPQGSPEKRLVIRGIVIMGGVAIKTKATCIRSWPGQAACWRTWRSGCRSADC